jgi:alpha-ketoglutarate-dependent taurine dioxygenase
MMLEKIPEGWNSTSFTLEAYRFQLPHSVISELELLGDSTQSPLLSQIKLAELSCPETIRYISDLRTRYVEGEPGYVILRGLNALARERWSTAFNLLSICIGDIYPQDSKNLDFREVRDRGTFIGEGSHSRYSDSRYGGSLHTDGAQAPLPVPDYFGLLCIQKAIEGGEFIMVDARTVYGRLLDKAPKVIEVLQRPFHFDRREGLSETAVKPIFVLENKDITISYLREYIDAGHSYENVPSLTPEQLDALEALDTVLADTSLRVTGCLAPGDIIFVNNNRIIHGRTTFRDAQEPEKKRLLLRVWLRKHSSFS